MKQVILIITLFVPIFLFSQQNITGKVIDINKKAISNAKISYKTFETKSDTLGNFSLKIGADSLIDGYLKVSHENYTLDSVKIIKNQNLIVKLKESFTQNATVKSGEKLSYIGTQTLKTEVITTGELKKAACCDLAGCFETQGTVQPMVTNIITNSKELRILGLSGVYNQVLIDGMPLIQGVTFTYGISSIPGTLVDNIYVAKGTTSVLQGFESMVGQINVVTKTPNKGDKLLLNNYINSFGENHHNINYQFGKKKISNLISFHTVQPAQKWDKDKDGFLDLPKLQRYMIFDKIKYGDETKKGLSSMVGIRYLWEQRIGGQSIFNANSDLGSTAIYGQKVNYQQAELYTKTSYKFNDEKRITLIASSVFQNQNSWFGTVNYKANQKNYYLNAQYEWRWHRNHELKTGISYRHFYLPENISFTDTFLKRTYGGKYLKDETIKGAFIENTTSLKGDILTIITGLRIDNHNQFGNQLTPRSMIKYDVTEKAVIRASVGTGWRTVNLFSENIGLLVSSRDIIFKETLKPEKSLNYGVNFLQKYKFKKIEGFFTFDMYQTRFQNQFFPDYNTLSTKAVIANFEGTSVSNGFQTDISSKILKKLEVKLAYNYLDVYRIENALKVNLPFISKHKFLMALSYLPKSKKWRADVNAHWFGRQELPNTESNPEEFKQAKFSKPYTTVNVQATKSWKKLEIYGGCENLFNFRQNRPIVSWQNPFSQYFDTSFNWGPTRGIEFYLGLRYMPFK